LELCKDSIQFIENRLDHVRDRRLQGQDTVPLEGVTRGMTVTVVLLITDRDLTSACQSLLIYRQNGRRKRTQYDSYETEDRFRSHVRALSTSLANASGSSSSYVTAAALAHAANLTRVRPVGDAQSLPERGDTQAVMFH
jgi:hypothetical protein